MLTICRQHGPQSGIMVSSDLLCKSDVGSPSRDCVGVRYSYHDCAHFAAVVSSQFAAEHGITAGSYVSEDCDLPEWNDLLIADCVKCVEEKYPGIFDTDDIWPSHI